MKKFFTLVGVFALLVNSLHAQKLISKQLLLTKHVKQYEKTEFEISAAIDFINPYDQQDVSLDMIVTSPSGKSLVVPCYFFVLDYFKLVLILPVLILVQHVIVVVVH